MMRQTKHSLILIGVGLLMFGVSWRSLKRLADRETQELKALDEKSWEMICYANDGVEVLFEGPVRDLHTDDKAWRATSVETGEQFVLNATCIARHPKDPS